jgi:DNA-binding response OmpR family regulator
MWQILMVTEAMDHFKDAVAPARAEGRCGVRWAGGFQAALDALGQRRPDLVGIDAEVGGRQGLALCRELMQTDAFVNLALVSDLDDDAFHEASEGLGLVGRLPRHPTPADVDGLLKRLAAIYPPL